MSTAMLPSNGSGMTFGLTPEASNADSSSSSSSSSSSTPTYKVPKFLRSLYSILQNEDESIVKWVQNQELKPNRVTAFHILDLARFENQVLPKHFKHSKFASFQRQLNNFGFRKWTKTQSSGVCTFSHNSFPPDPREIGVLRASIREQWRQKNNDTRRRVGNGITKAERKLQQQVQQQVQQLQQTGSNPASNQVAPQSPAPGKYDDDDETSEFGSPSRVESFSAMLKTPLDGPAPRAPTHQPQIKKLARPMGGEWVSGGLEAFGDHHAPMTAGKPALLPSLQVSSQPQSRHLPHVSYNNTINIGTFPHHHQEASPVYAPQPPPMMMMSSTPTQLEPWAWEPHTAPAAYFEVAPWTVHHDPSLVHKAPMYCHAPEQQVSPSSMEEFTFDSIMLFNE